MIDVVFITDSNYIVPTLVAVKSVILHKKDETEYHIHIVSSDKLDESVFSELNSDKVKVTVLKVKNYISNLHQDLPNRATSSALIKFLLPDILWDVDKCIYLDGDVIVTDDLTELYETKLGYNYLAAVRDSSNLYIDRRFNPNFDYFNSGVMLMNLTKMRKDNLEEKLVEAKKTQHPQIKFVDQEAFNTVCLGKVKLLPLKWNFLVSSMFDRKNTSIETINEAYDTKYKDFDDIEKDAKIIHYGCDDKPWKNPILTLADKWYTVYRQTNVYNKESDLLKLYYDVDVTVSLTSYKERIQYASQVIDFMWYQTRKPNRVVLYLSEQDFPDKELPQTIRNQIDNGKVLVFWKKENFKSHKK